MRIAILDLGTNTFHLLIAEVHKDSSYKIIFKTRAVVKLGRGGFLNNVIAPSPLRKAEQVIYRFKEYAEEYGAEKIFAFATSAIRSSSNGKGFTKKIKKETGIEIKIISGDDEAELIYYGVRQCISISDEPVLIMDIGGGSTEFIIANGKKIFWKQSYNIGAARLLDRFNPSDPVRPSEVKRIANYLSEVLKPLSEAAQKYAVRKLVGSSGSFDTMAEIIGHRFHRRNVIKSKLSYQFDMDEYFKIHQWLLKSTTDMRMKTKGLIKMRVDMIVLSSLCTNYVLKRLNLEEMFLSKYALKEGALWKIIHQGKK